MATAQLDLSELLMVPSEPITTTPAAAPRKPVRRHFYRCLDCLSVVATETKIPTGAVCDACSGKVEYMGVTTGYGLRNQVGFQPACDGRCIGAVGPNCDCQCGGENHGSGRVVPVYTDGPVPRLMVPKAAAVKAEAFRGLCESFNAAWQARYGYVTEQKRQGRYLDGTEYARYMAGRGMRHRFNHVKTCKIHGARNRQLGELITEIQAGMK